MNPEQPWLTSLADERAYHAHKITALTRFMENEGVAPEDTLANTGLTTEQVALPDTRISIRQLATTFSNILEHSSDPALALRAGQQFNVSHYGLYGFALLTSNSLRRTLEFAIQYHRLATPTTTMHLHEEGGLAHMSFVDTLGLEELLQFNMELQLSVVLSLFREVTGGEFVFDSVHLNYREPEHYSAYEEILQCPAYFEQTQTGYRMPAALLEQSLPKSNSLTDAMVKEICDDMLTEQVQQNDLTRRIYDLLLRDPANMPSAERVAEACSMTPRTLSRKLVAQGTSFQAIVDEVRKQLAINYLRSTRLSVDTIALHVGFSNAANFHNAFKRWTNKTPGMYRA